MITQVIKLSDLPILSNYKDIKDSRLIAVINNKTYSISLGQIKQNSIKKIANHLVSVAGKVINNIEIYWDDGNTTKLVLKNGSIGPTGDKGKTGEIGPKGDSLADDITGKNILRIVYDNITDDDNKIWSAYCGYKLNKLLESISEVFMDEYTYDLRYNEEKDEYGEYIYQQFINLELNNSSNNSTIINNNDGNIVLYKKYWTYEDDNELEYFITTNEHIETYVISNKRYFIWDNDAEIDNPKYDSENPDPNIPQKIKHPQYVETEEENYNSDTNIIHVKYIIDEYKLKSGESNPSEDDPINYSVKKYYNYIDNNTNEDYYFVPVDNKYIYNIAQSVEVDNPNYDPDDPYSSEPQKINQIQYKAVEFNTYKEYNNDLNDRYPKYIEVTLKDQKDLFDILNDYYLNPDNNNIYATRRQITEYDQFTNEISNIYYEYSILTKPVWLELEFTTDEDHITNILNNDYKPEEDIQEEPNQQQEDEVVIINKPIQTISLNNYEITIPINTVYSIPILITPEDYTDEIYINYDENVITVFEDGRIMAIQGNCQTYIEIYNTDDKNQPDKYPLKYAKLNINVITYAEKITLFNVTNIETNTEELITNFTGFKSIESHKSIFNIRPEVFPLSSTNQLLEWSIVDTTYAQIIVTDNNFDPINDSEINKNRRYYIYNQLSNIYEECTLEEYNNYISQLDEESDTSSLYYYVDTVITNNDQRIQLELLTEGSTQLEVRILGASSESIKLYNININTGITDIEIEEPNIKLFTGIQKTLSVNILPEDATEKKLTWLCDNPMISYQGNNLTCIVNAFDNSTPNGYIYVVSSDGYLDNVSSYFYYTIDIPVNYITIDGYEDTDFPLTLDQNTSITLHATAEVNPTNPQLVWESGNSSLFKVENLNNNSAKITALAGGTSSIIIKSTDGSGYVKEIPITCITLTQSITLQNTLIYMYAGYQYTIGTSDSDIIYTRDGGNTDILFYTSNDNIAKVINNNILDIRDTGNFKLYAKSIDNAGYITSINIKSYISSTELLLDEENEITISINDVYTIIASVYPDNTTYQKIEFKEVLDDNQSPIINIDEENGTIIPLEIGTTTISISTISRKGGKLSKTIKLNIEN